MTEALHIVCPHCLAVNRLPATRLQEKPKCGQCHQPLFTGQPIELNATGFDKHIGRNDIPVLVDFWADWCGPCKVMSPAFAQAAQLLEPHIRLGKVDTEAETRISSRYDIRSIPSLILFKAGRELARQAGAMSTQNIVRWVKNKA